jgi:hypothetical protein
MAVDGQDKEIKREKGATSPSRDATNWKKFTCQRLTGSPDQGGDHITITSTFPDNC